MKLSIFIFLLLLSAKLFCQTEIDGLMMGKNYFCVGATHTKSTWKNYWEGSFKRENLNLGKVTNYATTINGNYGITNKLNIIFTLPYIKTNASAGQLAGQNGLQDLSIYIKGIGFKKQFKKSILNTIIISGISIPVSNYTPDLLPLSIGLASKTASVRVMTDFQKSNWFATFSLAYLYRGNVKLDRNTYYTTRLHYTNEVAMPNVTNINLRAGYRSETWIIEAFVNKIITNGGFDITKNNIPFVSNKMNATYLGMHLKYETDFVNGLSFVADAIGTFAGRNVGQTNGFNFGIFYIMDFSKKEKTDIKK